MKKFWDGSGWIKKIIYSGAIGTAAISISGYIFGLAATTYDKANASSIEIPHIWSSISDLKDNEKDHYKALNDKEDDTHNMVKKIYEWELEKHRGYDGDNP